MINYLRFSGLTNRAQAHLINKAWKPTLSLPGPASQATRQDLPPAVKERTMGFGIIIYWACICSIYLSFFRLLIKS